MRKINESDLHLQFKMETNQYHAHAGNDYMLNQSKFFKQDYVIWLEENYLKLLNQTNK